MSITLTPEDQQKVEELVSSGRFLSVAEALHAGLEALHEDTDWHSYATDRISAGLEDIQVGRTLPVEEVMDMLRSARLQKA